jgi:hypothetical protein
MTDFRSRDRKAALVRTEIRTEQGIHSMAHTLYLEIATLEREQAEALQVAFIEWLKNLEFRR